MKKEIVKMFKKMLFIVSLAFVFSSVVFVSGGDVANAIDGEDTTHETGTVIDENDYEFVEEGKCGENLTYKRYAKNDCRWEFLVVISGTGDMYDYDFSPNSDEGIIYEYDYYDSKIGEEVTYTNNLSPFFESVTYEVIIEEGVTSIGDNSFIWSGIRSITIPDSVTRIGDYAFYGCWRLEDVNIPDSVKSIGGYAFGECYRLKIDNFVREGVCGDNLTYKYADGTLTISGTGDMYNAKLEYSHKGYSYKSFFSEGGAFLDNCLLREVVIEDGVTSIGEYAFYEYRGLTSITIPDSVTNIGKWAFYNCFGLDSITIPNGVTSIGEAAFRNCDRLVSITIPNGVTSIGRWAFYDCDELVSVTIPKSVTSIGESAFLKYESVYSKPENAIYGYKGTYAETYAAEYGIPFNYLLSNESFVSSTNVSVGSKVILNGAAIGGSGSYKYAYYYKKSTDENWKTAKNFSSSASVVIRPAEAGDYDICIKVKDSDDSVVEKFFTLRANDLLKNNSTIGSEAVHVGEQLKLTGAASGGSGDYTYAYYYKKTSDTKWVSSGKFSENSSKYMLPTTATSYDICIKVKDSSGSIVKKYFSLEVKMKPLKNTSTISSKTLYVGEKLNLISSASGGYNSYSYTYYYKKTTDTEWVTVEPPHYYWYPVNIEFREAATYNIMIRVTDYYGQIADKYYIVDVQELKNESTISLENLKLGEALTLNGAASGGNGIYEYAYYYKKTDEEGWVCLESFDTSEASAEMRVMVATEYSIRIDARDLGSNFVVSKYFTLKVNDVFENLSTISSETLKIGETLKLTGAASGGDGSYLYAYYYKKTTKSVLT